MVKDLAVANGTVAFTVELTTPACPLRESIETDCNKALAAIPGVKDLKITFGAQVRGSKTGGGQTDLLPTVKNVVLVAAGKGGVGKSTVAANLAVAWQTRGGAAALLAAPPCGPSVPTLTGVKGGQPNNVPVTAGYKRAPPVARRFICRQAPITPSSRTSTSSTTSCSPAPSRP